MEQTKALNALEPYVAMAQTSTSNSHAANVIKLATSNPNTYVFAELLDVPNIQKLADSPDHAPFLELLKIFSYRTYRDYTQEPSLPKLDEAQTAKLRRLSLLSLAKNPKNLTYAALKQALDLPDTSALERLVIDAVYAGLLDARLDQHSGFVNVSSVAPLRDPDPRTIPDMVASLRGFESRCQFAFDDIQAQIDAIKNAAAKRHAEKKARDQYQAKLLDDEKSSDAMGQRKTKTATLRSQGQPKFGGKRPVSNVDGNMDEDDGMDLEEDDPEDGETAGTGSGGGAPLGGPGKKRLNRRKN
ncbi:PCI domain-containing protein [Xylariaceae sp. FL1272]|nr:PCI domain-containing protein [Xylariaceae sp. FL1272]